MTSTPPSLPPPITEIGLRPAGFWIRLLASIIDTVVLTIILAPIAYTIYGRQYLTSTELVKGPADFLISYVLPALLVILLWITVRGTPGKLICGLRVVDARTGGKLDLLQATVRYLGYFVSMLALFLGFIWVAIDKRKQGFHDKMAGTLVIWNKSP